MEMTLEGDTFDNVNINACLVLSWHCGHRLGFVT